MSLYFKYADQFSDNQHIGFGFKLHVINFQFPSQTLTKGASMVQLFHACLHAWADFVDAQLHICLIHGKGTC